MIDRLASSRSFWSITGSEGAGSGGTGTEGGLVDFRFIG
jgi:hypothetical protein